MSSKSSVRRKRPTKSDSERLRKMEDNLAGKKVQVSAALIQQLSDAFDQLCQDRHELGQEKYGPVRFFEINTLQEAMFEVADLANYARYAYIKLGLIASIDPSTDLNTTQKAHVEPDDAKDTDVNPRGYTTGFFNPHRKGPR